MEIKSGIIMSTWMTKVCLSSPWTRMLVLPQLMPFRGRKTRSQLGQERSPNTLHLGSNISSMPWLSSILLSESWPLTRHTQHGGHLQPKRQLALKDKAGVQITRGCCTAMPSTSCCRLRAELWETPACVTSSVSKWHPCPTEKETPRCVRWMCYASWFLSGILCRDDWTVTILVQSQ